MKDDQNVMADTQAEQISGKSIFIVQTTAGGSQV
jgi:hypothetical protein